MFLIVDGTNLAHRAYHAFKARPDGLRVSRTGVPISVCSSVLQSLLATLRTFHPTHVAVCFDNGELTFRHDLLDGYKGGRPEKDELLSADLQNLQQLLVSTNIGVIAPPPYEADDVIATLSKHSPVDTALIYSGDRDLYQLATDAIHIYYPNNKTRNTELMTPLEVKAAMGIYPHQVCCYKALNGDKSDKIPGVMGIGEKKAKELLEAYESLDGIYENLWRFRAKAKIPKIHDLLVEGKADAYLSKHLATLVHDVPLSISPDQFALSNFNVGAMTPTLEEFGLMGLAQGLNQYLTSR